MSKRIAIVGGGFCGTVLAIQLLQRDGLDEEFEIHIIERNADIGPGIAYMRREWPYLLNVPASRLAVNSNDPLEFLRFAQASLPNAGAEDFLPRSIYGDYLRFLLRRAEQGASRGRRLIRTVGEVVDIVCNGQSGRFALVLSDSTTVEADRVVLATGNSPPCPMPWEQHITHHSAYHREPWRLSRAPSSQDTIVIIGSGLTMADVAVSAAGSALGAPHIVSISRRGLLPHAQTVFRALDSHNLTTALEHVSTVRTLTRVVRQLARKSAEQGGDWREIVTVIRHLAPAIWQRLSTAERQRFLRHLQSYWDVHRHRLPPQMASKLAALRQDGTLQLNAGRVVGMTPIGERITVKWLPRGKTRYAAVTADMVVNATGPNYCLRQSQEHLLRSMSAAGMITDDCLGLGLIANADLQCVGADGRHSTHLYYLGPMLRARYWEATAAPELRDHSQRLAVHLLAGLKSP